jgi:hypothetical protein
MSTVERAQSDAGRADSWFGPFPGTLAPVAGLVCRIYPGRLSYPAESGIKPVSR